MSKPDNPPATQGLDFHTGTSVPDSRQSAFPANEKVEPRIMIESRVFDDLLAHGRETTAVELCGVLVGTTRRDSTGPYLLIDGSIRGQHTRNDGAQVTFTHETWDHIHHQMESSFKNKSIVGWYHTHPGFGIFLSDMDKFIQDYFFNQPFQVALVIDPISSKEGLFAWVDGKTRPLSRCWIGKDVRKLTAGAVGSAETRDVPPAGKAGAQLVIEKRPATSDGTEAGSDNIINYSSL
ncbi:MAG TPA: Mov34/MPN/PAD-1 family protein, partial [Candidatus Ozemobacteraceae bacterium]|nr:Mov34/MPN/PAD-1 family protein [Candidatus Ozemobacteraceae bacterium]